MTPPTGPAKGKPPPPLWRQAFDAVEGTVAPRAESLVRTPYFAFGAALVQRAQGAARDSIQGLAARAWHLVNLPTGSDVNRLRGQIGALDREVRRLSLQLEAERRRADLPKTGPTHGPTTTEVDDADGAQPADSARPRPARRRAQRPARP